MLVSPLPRRSSWATLAVLALVLGACQDAGSGASAAPSEAGSGPASESTAASEAPDESQAASEAASAEPMGEGVVLVADSALGEILTDANGMTLYLFTNDSPNESACTGDCAANWPPLTVGSADEAVAGEGVTGELGTIEREDGTLQVTIEGVPLYLYAADAEPGDLSGHQVGSVWFAVGPDGEAAGEEAGQDDYEY
jgi:predicted lipoprotein with Yx(FWY)xxD motif